jgi:hypothetical protein
VLFHGCVESCVTQDVFKHESLKLFRNQSGSQQELTTFMTSGAVRTVRGEVNANLIGGEVDSGDQITLTQLL